MQNKAVDHSFTDIVDPRLSAQKQGRKPFPWQLLQPRYLLQLQTKPRRLRCMGTLPASSTLPSFHSATLKYRAPRPIFQEIEHGDIPNEFWEADESLTVDLDDNQGNGEPTAIELELSHRRELRREDSDNILGMLHSTNSLRSLAPVLDKMYAIHFISCSFLMGSRYFIDPALPCLLTEQKKHREPRRLRINL